MKLSENYKVASGTMYTLKMKILKLNRNEISKRGFKGRAVKLRRKKGSLTGFSAI